MFTFRSPGHFFAALVHDVKVGLDATTEFITQHQAAIDQAGEIGATVISVADPALAPIATSIERAGESLLGEALAAVSALDAAATSPVSITLDVDAVQELKTLFRQIKSVKGAAAVPPANLSIPKAA